MISNFLKPYRPNPFRFIWPRLYKWMFPLFYIHNALHVRHVLGVHQTEMSEQSVHNLSQVKSHPGHHLILSSHSSFMDPPFLMDAFRRANKLMPVWIAGHDVLHGLRGFREWYLSTIGVMSLDRGVTDRRSLSFAQSVLDSGKQSLLIFPEGEADYCNMSLRPFYAGACMLVLNAALKSDDGLPVKMFPIFLYHPFISAPQSSLQKAIEQYLADLSQRYPNPKNIPDLTEDNLPDCLRQLLRTSLAAININLETTSLNLSEAFNALAKATLINLYATYLPSVLNELDMTEILQNFQSVMSLKNQMSSYLLRHINAPILTDVLEDDAKLDALACSLISIYETQQLKILESKYLGIMYLDDAPTQRIARLKDMLKNIMPFVLKREQASDEQLTRWREHLEDCRRVKSFYLIAEDIQKLNLESEASKITWEAFDEVVTKLEIAMISKFRFREPRRLEIIAGEPIDVRQFIEENNTLTRKAMLTKLTQTCYDAIQVLMDSKR